MGKLIDLTGQRFGRLVALERVENAKDGKVQWKCKCDCGNEVIVKTNNLRSGNTKSCGCYAKDRISETQSYNLIGQQFYYLTVIERIGPNSGRKIIWRCKCKCGNETRVVTSDLVSGNTKSCGCLQKEKTSQRLDDLTGKKFGLLLVLERDLSDKNYKGHSTKWLCQCKCGKIVSVSRTHLIDGHSQSCGCLKMSHGELKIKQLLEQNNIKFIQEYTPTSLSFLGRFDFAILNSQDQLKYLIEYDGEQHFRPKEIFGGEKEFKIRQEYDNIKNKWCKENNIPLIRIPYTHFKEIELKDLLLETSNFIIKGG